MLSLLLPQLMLSNIFGIKSCFFFADIFVYVTMCQNQPDFNDFNDPSQRFPSLCTCCNGMSLLILKILKMEDIFKFDLDGGWKCVQSL